MGVVWFEGVEGAVYLWWTLVWFDLVEVSVARIHPGYAVRCKQFRELLYVLVADVVTILRRIG